MENSSIMAIPNETSANSKYLSSTQQIIITVCYIMGILGNMLALVFLCRKGTRPSNPKYKLMLKCLSINDLTAMLGMLTLMYIQLYLPVAQNIWYCRARVVWRVFGLGSGCVAIVMAVERWLALTKPFLYQKVSFFGLYFISARVIGIRPFRGIEKFPRGFKVFAREQQGLLGILCGTFKVPLETMNISFKVQFNGF